MEVKLSLHGFGSVWVNWESPSTIEESLEDFPFTYL